MVSMYGAYIKERLGRGIIETEEGFATFEYPTDDIVYVVDIYVKPEHRRKRVAWEFMDIISKQAKKDGKKSILTSAEVASKGAEESIKAQKAYGMVEHKIDGTMIFFIKSLEDEVV